MSDMKNKKDIIGIITVVGIITITITFVVLLLLFIFKR